MECHSRQIFCDDSAMFGDIYQAPVQHQAAETPWDYPHEYTILELNYRSITCSPKAHQPIYTISKSYRAEAEQCVVTAPLSKTLKTQLPRQAVPLRRIDLDSNFDSNYEESRDKARLLFKLSLVPYQVNRCILYCR